LENDGNQLGGRSSAAASLQFITRSGSASKTKLQNYHCFDSFFLLASGKLKCVFLFSVFIVSRMVSFFTE